MSEYARRARPAPESYQPPRARLQAIPAYLMVAPPQPGTGTVFVEAVGNGQWRASWQAGLGILDFAGSREAALDWARTCDAPTRLVFDDQDGRYKPLDA